MGGLVSAGLLAARGKKVVLFEKHEKVGGYVTGFMRDGFYFDATGAFVAAIQPGEAFHQILSQMGVVEDLSFIHIGDVWNIYPGFDLRLNYLDPSAHLESVRSRFPDLTDAIDAYEMLTRRLGQEFLTFEQSPLWRKLMLPFFFPTLLKYARKSHGEVIHQFFGENTDIRLALSTLPTSLPPNLLSYPFVAVLWAKVLKNGVYYPKGGMKNLTETMARGIQAKGVEIVCNQEVRQIITRNRRAIGVLLSSGEQIHGDWIIANSNPYEIEARLSEPQPLYGKMHRLNRFRLSHSAILFYIKIKQEHIPSDWPYFVSAHTTKDLEAMYQGLESGSLDAGMHVVITIPSLLDKSLAPAGFHSLKVLVHAPRAHLFIRKYGSEQAFDKLRRHIFTKIRNTTGLDLMACAESIEAAGPDVLERYTGNPGGAMYGLDAACGQVGPQRPPNRTAVKNLLCAGHYAQPSHGIVGAAMSGEFAARVVLAES